MNIIQREHWRRVAFPTPQKFVDEIIDLYVRAAPRYDHRPVPTEILSILIRAIFGFYKPEFPAELDDNFPQRHLRKLNDHHLTHERLFRSFVDSLIGFTNGFPYRWPSPEKPNPLFWAQVPVFNPDGQLNPVFTPAFYNLAQPFANRSELTKCGFDWQDWAPYAYLPFNQRRPVFEDEPIYGDAEERRAWRNRYRRFKENDLRDWEEDKTEYEKEHKTTHEMMGHLERILVHTPYYFFVPFNFPATLKIPFDLPEKSRLEHHWIIATSGHGKTQCLQTMIARDLEAVAQNKASIVVMDSEEVMIPTISRLKLFAPGEPLHGKLIYLDPKDVHYPLSFNLFDIGQDKPKDRYSQYQQSNEMLDLFRFILGGLLEKDMTSKQRDVFEFCSLFLLSVPGATIQDFLDLLEPKGLEPYRQYLLAVDPIIRRFFEKQFDAKGQSSYESTKQEVSQRVY